MQRLFLLTGLIFISPGTILGQSQIAETPWGHPSLEVTERFERIGDDTVLWQTTVSDPEIYHSEWTVEIPLERRSGQKIYEYACHEGNQAVGNILRGARVQSSR